MINNDNRVRITLLVHAIGDVYILIRNQMCIGTLLQDYNDSSFQYPRYDTSSHRKSRIDNNFIVFSFIVIV